MGILKSFIRLLSLVYRNWNHLYVYFMYINICKLFLQCTLFCMFFFCVGIETTYTSILYKHMDVFIQTVPLVYTLLNVYCMYEYVGNILYTYNHNCVQAQHIHFTACFMKTVPSVYILYTFIRCSST